MPPCQTWTRPPAGYGGRGGVGRGHDVADAAAQDDAQRGPCEEVVGQLGGADDGAEANQVADDAPADDEAGDVGQGVPADLQGAEAEQGADG